MLIDMMTGKTISTVPYASEYKFFMSRMTSDEISEIKSALNEKIEVVKFKRRDGCQVLIGVALHSKQFMKKRRGVIWPLPPVVLV